MKTEYSTFVKKRPLQLQNLKKMCIGNLNPSYFQDKTHVHKALQLD